MMVTSHDDLCAIATLDAQEDSFRPSWASAHHGGARPLGPRSYRSLTGCSCQFGRTSTRLPPHLPQLTHDLNHGTAG